MRYRLRTLLAVMAAIAVSLGLLRGVIVEPEPYWGLYLLAVVAVCSGIAGIVIVGFDPQRISN